VQLSGKKLSWRRPMFLPAIRAFQIVTLLASLQACSSNSELLGVGPGDGVDAVRNADLTARFPTVPGGMSQRKQASRPMLFPGIEGVNQADRSHASPADPGVTARATGEIEINFDQVDIQAVAKSLIGDTLGLNFTIDPRVQGTITIVSAGPIARRDVLPTLESVLRMSNAAVVHDGKIVKIIPALEAAGAGTTSFGLGTLGYGVTILPLRYTSAAVVAKAAENFLVRPGAIRTDPARNLILIQGTTSERQSALDMVASFDVEWLRNQSVGVYPLKSTSPDAIMRDLEKIFETAEGGRGAGAVSFQPISRMNAVMAVARSQKTLERVTQWVRRLDRSEVSGTTVRVYRLENGSATRIAKILNEIFVGKGASAMNDAAANQIAPGANATQSKLDSLSNGSSFGNNGGGGSNSQSHESNGAGGAGQAASAFGAFSDQKNAEADAKRDSAVSESAGSLPRGVFQNVRVTADAGNNSIIIFSNQEDYRTIERSLRELDRPQLQVAIEATVAEVSLTDALQYGVQYYLGSSFVNDGKDRGSAALSASASSAILHRVLPGFNLLLGPEAQPHVILNALSTMTNVTVLSAPSLVVADNEPALLQVGQQIPISTGSATVLSSANTIVNTIQMRDTGVILKVWPHVHANGTINLEVEQEISNVLNSNGLSQNLTPTISQRRIHSTISVTTGQTVLLGGLISEQDNKMMDGIPVVRQISYLGDLFGRTDGLKNRSEIIVFIKPQIIRNGLDAQGVAEEFRSRLQAMRSVSSIIAAPPESGSQLVRVRK
jgi:general secretion pathway protein D